MDSTPVMANMENQMEEKMEHEMEATIRGLGFRALGE